MERNGSDGAGPLSSTNLGSKCFGLHGEGSNERFQGQRAGKHFLTSYLLLTLIQIDIILKLVYVSQAAFVPSLTGYDVIIHLNPHLVPYSSERVDKRPSLKDLPDTVVEQVVPPVEFHPVHKYLEELRVRLRYNSIMRYVL